MHQYNHFMDAQAWQKSFITFYENGVYMFTNYIGILHIQLNFNFEIAYN
jgi:hypothetical protein